MICYTCEKFIKKGHGKNTYYYAGEWIYYCLFCLRWNYCSQRIARRRGSYLFRVIFITLILSSLISCLTVWWINKNIQGIEKSNFFWLALFLASLPIIGAIILWKLKIKPKLNKLNKKDQKPLLEEKAKLTRMENYAYSLKRDKEICHCERCLMAEWKKKKF